MSLSTSTEPARTVSLTLVSVIVAVGAGFAAANAAWVGAPNWFRVLSVAVTAVVSALGIGAGGETIRNNVSPVVSLPSMTARSNLAPDGSIVSSDPASVSVEPSYDADGAPVPPGHPDAVEPGTEVVVPKAIKAKKARKK